VRRLFVFAGLEKSDWWRALNRLERALAGERAEEALAAYARLFRALSGRPTANLLTAAAEELLWRDSSLSRAALTDTPPEGLLAAAHEDMVFLQRQLQRDWHGEAERLLLRTLPPLQGLDGAPEEGVAELAERLRADEVTELLGWLLRRYRSQGAGLLARYLAFRWQRGRLRGIAQVALPDLAGLVALERQLSQLRANTEAFLAARPAHHTLLYGPRGSGKSTAVRGLLRAYAERNLRLVEVPVAALGELPRIAELLRPRPHRYLLFVDDLAFESNDHGYQPLKTLLEGSFMGCPDNLLVIATSNRRHLVRENFSDRPDPLNDDVHRWDTHNERLALADRFGLTITFPGATQKRYLLLVTELARREGLELPAGMAAAVRFAEWGNGYSGRTAQQYIDSVRAKLV